MLDFFANNLLWFIIGTVVFGFALLGYFVENGFRGKQILKKVTVDKPNVEIDEIEKIKSNLANSNQSLNQVVQGGSEDVLDMGDSQSASGATTPSASNVIGGPVVAPAPMERQPVVMSDEPVLDINAPVAPVAPVGVQQQVINPGGVAPVSNGQVINNQEQVYDQPLMNDESVVSGTGFQG